MNLLRSLATCNQLSACNGLAHCVATGASPSSLSTLQLARGLTSRSAPCSSLIKSFSTYESPQLNLVPMVIERTQRGERSFDIFSRLLRERIVSLTGPIDDRLSHLIVAQLLYLESEAPEKPVSSICFAICLLLQYPSAHHLHALQISMYINSPGGSVTAGLAIYDTMQYIRSPGSNSTCSGNAHLKLCSLNPTLQGHHGTWLTSVSLSNAMQTADQWCLRSQHLMHRACCINGVSAAVCW